ARGHQRAVRAAGRDHRGQRVVYLRPGLARVLRRYEVVAEARRHPGPGQRAAAPGGHPVPAQRLRFQARHLPGAGRRGGNRAGVRGKHRAHRVFRRRGGAHRRGGRADRRNCGREGRNPHLPGDALITPEEKLRRAIESIEAELHERLKYFRDNGMLLEAQRLEQRTKYDLEMLQEVGYCQGVENYSRHLDGRAAGEPPATLLDYFPKDYLMIIDESHQTIPQVRAMYNGDRSRKETLVEYGFRLPSALDNRPLTF